VNHFVVQLIIEHPLESNKKKRKVCSLLFLFFFININSLSFISLEKSYHFEYFSFSLLTNDLNTKGVIYNYANVKEKNFFEDFFLSLSLSFSTIVLKSCLLRTRRMLVALNYQLCIHLRVNLIDTQSLLAYLVVQLSMGTPH